MLLAELRNTRLGFDYISMADLVQITELSQLMGEFEPRSKHMGIQADPATEAALGRRRRVGWERVTMCSMDGRVRVPGRCQADLKAAGAWRN